MYFGVTRFHYMNLFFQGYAWKRSSFCLLPNNEMQYWLLHTQSASLHSGEMVARSLFYRVFGAREQAFAHYKAFLETHLPEDPTEVAFDLYSYEHEHNTVRYDWEDDVPPDHHERLAANVVDEIAGMIGSAGFTYDALRVYVRREPLFVQVRFLFRASGCWMDDTEIIAKDENHGALLAIHANARNASAAALSARGCDVNDEIEFSNSWENCQVHDLENLVTDNNSFLSEYQRWKRL